ncbi:hypothetical protein JCM11491_003615 [Sporobolomyces phaffii]
MPFRSLVLLSFLLSFFFAISQSSATSNTTFGSMTDSAEPAHVSLVAQSTPTPTQTAPIELLHGNVSLAYPTDTALLARAYLDSPSEDDDDAFWTSAFPSFPPSPSTDRFAYSYRDHQDSNYCRESYDDFCRRVRIPVGGEFAARRKRAWERWRRRKCWDRRGTGGRWTNGGVRIMTSSLRSCLGVYCYGVLLYVMGSLL